MCTSLTLGKVEHRTGTPNKEKDEKQEKTTKKKLQQTHCNLLNISLKYKSKVPQWLSQ